MQTEAWHWSGPGAASALYRAELDLPQPGETEVLVQNRVIGFNPVDWKLIRSGHPDWQPGQVPGVDGMGIIVAAGHRATQWQIGSRVAYHTDLRRHGSFARHTLVPARALLPVPEALSDAAAAAFPCPGLTAWQVLAKLPSMHGEAVLINGAGSNVGRFTVCLALAVGLRVFASASPAHHDALRRRGVQAVVDYHAPDWLAQLRAANGGEPFAAAIDLVSAASALELVPHLGYYGHLISALGRIESNPLPAFTHCLSLHEIALGAQHAHGSDKQWHTLVAAGTQMLHKMAIGELPLPPLEIANFDALAEHLDRAARLGGGAKYLVQL